MSARRALTRHFARFGLERLHLMGQMAVPGPGALIPLRSWRGAPKTDARLDDAAGPIGHW